MTAPTKLATGIISPERAAEIVGVAPAVLRHEVFCLPRPGELAPRIESYVALSDDPKGRSRPTHDVTRCLECGAASYRERN